MPKRASDGKEKCPYCTEIVKVSIEKSKFYKHCQDFHAVCILKKCAHTFLNKADRDEHTLDTGHFECNNCKQRFKSNQALFTHRRKVHLGLQDDKTKGTIVCKFKECKTTFKHEKGYKHHYTTVHEKFNVLKN